MNNLKQNYSHIAVIGNGFDLNLGLKTSYTDFIRSEEFLELQKMGNYLTRHLAKKHELQTWIDIENELKVYSSNMIVHEGIVNLENDFYSVSNALKNYLTKLSYDKLNKTSHSYKLLEQLKNQDFLILDFNYTKTTEIILLELGVTKEEIDKRIIKVHGSLNEGEIIFGVEDSAKIKPGHVFLRKAYNKTFKAINVNINLKNVTEIHIFGYSLGETDHMYFERFFQDFSLPSHFGKGKKIFLYYYGPKAYKELFIQIDKLTSNSLTVFKQNNDFTTIDTSI